MQDDWHGHRDPFTGAKQGDKDEWLEWDFLLLNAFQTVEDFTDEYGILKWVHDDPAVRINAKSVIHKFAEARDRITSQPKRKTPKGESFIPEVYSRRTDEEGNEVTWTFREWVENQAS